MSRKVDALKLRALREERGWSQEHLAMVSGLGLRTIQRIEADGKTSLESALALASVFETSVTDLWLQEPENRYDHYQISYLIFICLALIVGAMSPFIGPVSEAATPEEARRVELSFLAALTFVGFISFIFSSLRIRIDREHLRWNFGLSVIRGSINIDEISDAKVVKNKWWYGVGVRVLPHCILYNITGLDAVEIIQRNGRITRLGTDEPEVLVEAIKGCLKP